MIIYKKDKFFMIDEKELDYKESIKFVKCLEIELQRHKDAIEYCIQQMPIVKTMLEMTFWFSSHKRHQDDIENINKSIEYLKQKWELERINTD